MGFGQDQIGIEVDELPVVFRFVFGPDGAHRLHFLAGDLPSILVDGAVVFHLLAVPSGTDTKDHASARYRIERCDLLRECDRIAFDDETDTGAEGDVLGHCRARAPRATKGSWACQYCFGRSPPPGNGVSRLAGNVRVLGKEQAVEDPALPLPAPVPNRLNGVVCRGTSISRISLSRYRQMPLCSPMVVSVPSILSRNAPSSAGCYLYDVDVYG